MSLGKANYCLRGLLGKSWVKVQNFHNSENKRAYAYLLTPAGIEAKAKLTLSYLRRKQAEYEAMRREIDALQEEVDASGDLGAEVRA
ncbi:transcriptional regulator [Pandoraea communis]|uniref:Transcriptional regulator n=1 Tax=Pandoraea communis TaxID=2508297 RepID=A0A5E4T6A1_9BURK|nr:transcriptional regulator [Pandoraea sp. SD6-2]VVD82503.1 transcriptional regulator [Pandoraea communis]